jgi:hypothetical protein
MSPGGQLGPWPTATLVATRVRGHRLEEDFAGVGSWRQYRAPNRPGIPRIGSENPKAQTFRTPVWKTRFDVADGSAVAAAFRCREPADIVKNRKGRQALPFRPGEPYPIGVLATVAPAPVTLARITPDWSVKNMRCPVCPTAMGIAVSV